jgi:Bacterial aa3 type cytochrome c oxidase subunit IV
MALASNVEGPGNEDLADHLRTYRTFVRYAFLFAAHVLVILALMAYFLT